MQASNKSENDGNEPDNMSGYDVNDPGMFFFLISKIRFNIIEILAEQECSLQQLHERIVKEDIRTNQNNVKHHVDLLIENEIVKKTNGKFSLTNFGRESYRVSQSLRFLWSMKDYFKRHTSRDLPIRFSLGMGIMVDTKMQLIDGRPRIVRKLEEMYRNSNEYIYNILHEVEGTDNILNILLDKLKNNSDFHTKTIFGKNSIFDPNRDASAFRIYKESKQIKQKKIDEIRISTVVTDKSAFIVFPLEDEHSPDMKVILYGEDEEFRQWCLDYFLHEWNNAGDEIRIK